MTKPSKRRAVKVRRHLRRGAYLLPSLFTSGSIVLGFAAIVGGLRDDFKIAAVLVIVAAILDFLDGRMARLIGIESEFGKQFDSLADVLTFGLVPALLAYLWGFQELGRIGWLVPVFFVLCAAVRLARFNVQTKVVDSRYFVGLPAPAAAGTVVSILFLITDGVVEDVPQEGLAGAMLVALGAVGVLMVSTFRYPSFKTVDLRRPVSYRMALMVAAALLVLVYRPTAVVPAAAVCFTLSGPLAFLAGRLRHRLLGAESAERREAA